MKKISTLTIILLSLGLLSEVAAQSPGSFRYQAALQNSTGQSLAGRKVSFMITVLKSAMEKERVYAEFHTVNTDPFGLVSLEIGKGNPVFKTFKNIDWGAGEHFLRVEIDETGGTQFKLLNEVQLLSVPYALYAERAGSVDDADADPTNELQTLSVDGRQLSISNGNAVELPIQNLKLAGYDLSISDGNMVTLPGENHLQTLTLDGRELSISDGNSITLPDDRDQQTLSIKGNTLSISNGNAIELPSADTHDPAAPVAVAFRGQKIYAHPTDNSEGIAFGPFGDTGADSDHDGKANTEALISAHGDGSYAAKLCDDLTAFGHDDWYLPSRAELDALFKQNYLIADYSLEGYWTSTETAHNMAWEIDFTAGKPDKTTKNQNRRCRCVRSE